MRHLLASLSLVLILSSCGSAGPGISAAPVEFQNKTTPTDSLHPITVEHLVRSFTEENDDADLDLEARLDQAEAGATREGRSVLHAARSMISGREIILGSCWDYIDAIYTRSGSTGRNRTTVFHNVQAGPYADISTVQTGDWLYFINHSYGDVEHSAIFVSWLDVEQKEAFMIAYVGGNRAVPARYTSYELSSVYNIIRPKAGMVIPSSTPAPIATPASVVTSASAN